MGKLFLKFPLVYVLTLICFCSSDRFAYNVGPTSSLLNPMSENTAYATQPRYDNSYIAHPTSRPISGPGIRPGEQIPGSHPGWHVPPLLAPLHHVETYVSV